MLTQVKEDRPEQGPAPSAGGRGDFRWLLLSLPHLFPYLHLLYDIIVEAIRKYIQKFAKLHVSRSNGIAPHKPILLLSIIRLIDQNEIRENKIYITPQLVACFKEVWHSLVTTERFTANFSLPFFHLKTGKFWHLQTYPGAEIFVTSSGSIRSFAALKNAVAYACFDADLFDLLCNNMNRAFLQKVLVRMQGWNY